MIRVNKYKLIALLLMLISATLMVRSIEWIWRSLS